MPIGSGSSAFNAASPKLRASAKDDATPAASSRASRPTKVPAAAMCCACGPCVGPSASVVVANPVPRAVCTAVQYGPIQTPRTGTGSAGNRATNCCKKSIHASPKIRSSG
ncbi:MAG TPA: hypothetical protein PLT12_10185 [Kiritimatiellia bacterium]|nr:hypothetical protein [Kiritimatiellia bacterium]HOR75228.1 hypothetical protein [Kiritimatiellia bacterium]HPK70222.1 hypothetical protein [Kiritimatiellia bacterium]